ITLAATLCRVRRKECSHGGGVLFGRTDDAREDGRGAGERRGGETASRIGRTFRTVRRRGPVDRNRSIAREDGAEGGVRHLQCQEREPMTARMGRPRKISGSWRSGATGRERPRCPAPPREHGYSNYLHRPCDIGSWGVLGGAESENGRLRQGSGCHPGGDRRRSVLMLPTLRAAEGRGSAAASPKRAGNESSAAFRRASTSVAGAKPTPVSR